MRIALLIRLGALLAVFCLAVLTTSVASGSYGPYVTQDGRYIRIGNESLEIVLKER
jgi:hypothetical protein